MPSNVPGYEYDIFISYRQKDNKGDHWVSEFVDALKTELESTFKEEISVYFDINPHDGLLETHDVDASLKEKLKCLIFIPIISRTYCDPKSFAWEHELKAFVKLAAKDPHGLKISLHDGNVASRVLPVMIHNLDTSDIALCESVLDGYMRGIEFIYREPGVNRPLTKVDGDKTNLNRTLYKNQINKVALAIKGIISALQNGSSCTDTLVQNPEIKSRPILKDKSIIVLPFDNISAEPDQDYFSDGLTEEIITDLSHIHDLIVISRSSAMTFKGSKKTIPEIAREVNVRFVLEGSVRKSGNQLRITAQLIDAITDSHIWAEKYNGNMDDVFVIQENVSMAIASQLKLKLSEEERVFVLERPIKDIRVYEYYLKARSEIYNVTESSLEKAIDYLEKALIIQEDNPGLYAELGHAYYQFWNFGIRVREEDLTLANKYVNMALVLDPRSPDACFVSGLLNITGGNVLKAIPILKGIITISPNHSNALGWLALVYSFLGMKRFAANYAQKLVQVDPFFPFLNYISVFSDIHEGNFDQAEKEAGTKTDDLGLLLRVIGLVYNFKLDETQKILGLISPAFKSGYFFRIINLLCLAGLKREKEVFELMDDRFMFWASKDFQYAYQIAEIYAFLGHTEKAIDWLENSVNLGCVNYNFFNKYDPFLKGIRSEERFKRLMEITFKERMRFLRET